METVRATSTWSPTTDVYRLYAEPPASQWAADPVDGAPLVFVLRELDDDERETGRIAGVEIVGFLDFDCWEALPTLPLHWWLPGWEPLLLEALLRRQQDQLRRQTPMAARQP